MPARSVPAASFTAVERPENLDRHTDDEPELGPGSMLFLRALSVLVVVIVVYFIVDAISG